MKLTSELIEGFAGVFLSGRYDDAQPTPDFHRECWDLYCSDYPACAVAAPRNHAKSTALTHDFVLANVLFRTERYVIIIGASEESSIEHLGDIANELRENEELRAHFKIKGFLQDQKTDIIIECADGHKFRILARGAGQKIRGRKWMGARPGLIVADDLEDDELVLNKDSRRKFRQWFFRACKPALRDGGRIRVHGTILHYDSLLSHLMKANTWRSRRYRAHRSFSEFTNILWPEKFPAERLLMIRQEFIDEGDSAGYSQEYLNDPRDNDDTYLRQEYFLPMTPEDHEKFKLFAVGVDFAISKSDSANRTAFVAGGKDAENLVHITDVRKGRWDAEEIIDEFFSIEARWHPQVFFVENGQIWKAIEKVLQSEMQRRDIWLNIEAKTPISDKAARGRSLQKRMKSGGCRFNKETSWYAEYEEELLLFTGVGEALLDDQFDASANLAKGFETFEVSPEDEWTEEEIEFEAQSRSFIQNSGRSPVTGY